MRNRAGLFLFLLLGLPLALWSCTQSKPEASTPFVEEAAKDKPLPYNKLLNGTFPTLRQDTFYTTETTVDGKKQTINDRLVSNGKGFVAYCESETFDRGYYLYNFYGHSSYFVVIGDRTYKVALHSPGDDILAAYQMFLTSLSKKQKPSDLKVEKLGPKKIEGTDCLGLAYTADDGSKHEEWFDLVNRRLVSQTIERPSLKMKLIRHLKRVNTYCETMFLRLPEGYNLVN